MKKTQLRLRGSLKNYSLMSQVTASWSSLTPVSDAPPSPPRAWAEIDLAALRHNLAVAREVSGQRVMAVVKAGAYGHGLEPLAQCLAGEEIAFFGVANVSEARRLTTAGITTPIYLLGATFPEEREEVIAQGWVPCLNTLEEARHFASLAQQAGQVLKAHLTVDTGMGRGGFLPSNAATAFDEIQSLPEIQITGLGSHLPSADEDPEFTRAQFGAFDSLVESLPQRQQLEFVHLANSAGLLGYTSRTTNLVRPGLLLYGVSPIKGHQEKLRTVMTLKSRVLAIRDLPAGHGISYGRSFVTERPTWVATIGIGYGDGYPRALSDHSPEVFIRGHRAPLIGRVTMDQVMADVTDHPGCESGDEVELFGQNIPVHEVAENAGTIAWDVFTSITPRVQRIYLG